jgi:RNA polymerase sigma-70 factor (ECF subfamily)
MNVEVTVPAQSSALADLVADQAAFRAWYDRTLPRVYRYLLVRCGDEALAEELTQQTFIEAVRHRHQYQGRAEVATWLITIARRKLIDHYRHVGADHQRALRIAERGGDPTTTETRVAVLDALDRLAPDQRLALTYRYLDQLPVREIADVLGRSEAATASLLARARDAFRVAYGDETDG